MEIDSTCQICKEEFTDFTGKEEICAICYWEWIILMKFTGVY